MCDKALRFIFDVSVMEPLQAPEALGMFLCSWSIFVDDNDMFNNWKVSSGSDVPAM